MKKIFIWILLLIGVTAQSQTKPENLANPFTVSTFECASLYWKTTDGGACKVRYKETKSKTWKEGLGLVYVASDGEYRGSIVGLIPNTEYQAELNTSTAQTKLKFTTRSDKFPIGKTTYLPDGETDQPIVITQSGTPDAYHLVTVPINSKSNLNLKNSYNNGIEIDADYVIVRGVEIRNAAVHGILIKKQRHDIVVEQCHITFWGRIGGSLSFGNKDGNMDSGIYVEEGGENMTFQRNLIENPRGAANDWDSGHPAGPQGISIIQSKGGHVIRYNEITSTEDHGFNDAIGGGSNGSPIGNMHRDSDIYGNLIRSAWDDAIESEGGNMNVRIWGNYAHFYYNAIGSAATVRGPLYVFRNVFGESRKDHRNYLKGVIIKVGGGNDGGRRFIFHNTALQPNGAFSAFSAHDNVNNVTRNNIFDVPGRLASDVGKEPASDLDYDFFTGISQGIAKEANGITTEKTKEKGILNTGYIASYYLEFYPRGTINSINWNRVPIKFGDQVRNITDPVLQVKNPVIDSGVIIPGFNEDFKGKGPDMGAFELGAAPIRYGRRAYLPTNEGWAPWEIL